MKPDAPGDPENLLPAGFLHVARGARGRPHRRADGVRAGAVAASTKITGFWLELARSSLLLMWIGLTGTAALCWSARSMREHDGRQTSRSTAMALVGAVIGTISVIVWWGGRSDCRGDQRPCALVPDQPRRLRASQPGDRPRHHDRWRCATSTCRMNGSATWRCRPGPACTRFRRASARTFSSTA